MSINISKIHFKWVLYGLTWAFFLSFLLLSNVIFGNFSGSNIVKDSLDHYQNGTAACKVYIDEYTIGTNLFQQSALYGWAFCETHLSNESRQVKYVFVSEENVYSLQAELLKRSRVKSTFLELLSAEASDMLGAMASFSPITMKDGIYELYVYCWENDQDYGMASTGKKFLKRGRVFEEYFFQSDETDILAAEEPISRCTVDGVKTDAANIEVKGWAYLEGLDCAEQEVFVQLTGENGTETFTTESRERADVVKAYGSDSYLESGYVARIPAAELEAGGYALELYVKNGDRIAGTEKGMLQISEDGTATYQAASAVAPVMVFQSEKVEVLNSQDTLENRMVEKVVSSGTVVEIKGWAFLEGRDCAEQEVFVQLTGESGTKTFTTESRERADVAEAYGSGGYLESGYVARIPAAELEAGSYTLELYVKNGDRIAGDKKGILQICEDGTTVYENSLNNTTEFLSSEAEPLTVQEKLVKKSVDQVLVKDGILEIKGWAFLEGMNCAEQKVFVQLTGENGTKAFTTESLERVDVARAYGNEAYTTSGYRMRVPVAQLEAGAYSLEVLVQNGNRTASSLCGVFRLETDGSISTGNIGT